ncbi:uncharacterized protein N7483_008404 [Penicillium malachiteum]|uniref:uncharacterized protein n=1 Tax=Penicillium malachiteum TaxID=1324776 RepID=UPI002547AAB0|nr:uncharacterized protein N7483_008404 [Penicillium malachiteum]KAJ5720470.1 hypothetical protein N7483_008404 [Penicillium malachiteum]
MQMEPWRKRGYVPDSDEEDEFESLESNNEVVNDTGDHDIDLEYLPVTTSATVLESKGPAEGHKEIEDNDSTTLSDTEEARRGSVELLTSPAVIRKVYTKELDLPSEGSAKKSKDHPKDRPRSASVEEETPKPRRPTNTYGKRLSSGKKITKDLNDRNGTRDQLPHQDDTIWDLPSSPAAPNLSSRKARRRGRQSTPKVSTPTKTPQSSAVLQQKLQDSQLLGHDARSRSSSPDELNVVEEPVPQRRPEKEIDEPEEPPLEDSENDSPLSSAPLSIPSLEEDTPEKATAVEEEPRQKTPEVLVSEIDTPQELLEEIQAAQPAGRIFRERNAIQIHPYELEKAKYQRLMKEGGIRPVRPIMEEERKRAKEATDESQEQDEFEPFRSSPPPEEYLPPERPERRRERDNSPSKSAHVIKRRRKTQYGTWHDATSEVGTRPQVIINNSTPPRKDPRTPDSGISSATQTPRAADGFRFPPGFTPPPTTTTAAGSKSATPRVDEQPNAEQIDSKAASDDSEASDSSQGSYTAPGETAEEREIRRIQRQTKGVLPASWVRLEARQRLEQQKASQQNRNVATQRADAKGVARKIVRKSGQSGRTISFVDLEDSDDSEDEGRNRNADDQTAEKDDGGSMFASQAPFNDNDAGEIMEDNRVDYMLPTVPRQYSASLDRRKSLKRPKPKESAHERERLAKKARLKRQTRLTDGSYGTRRTKKSSSRSAPRLGILDAPDVASRPRDEQPLFLRVAARGVRSRRDAGRRSPTRKFIQLSSKVDTTDANQALQEWKRGKIRQSKNVRPQSKPRKSRPLANLSSRRTQARQVAQQTRYPEHAPDSAPREVDPIMVDDEDHIQQENVSANVAATPVEMPQNRQVAAVRPSQLEKHGHQWVVRRNIAISSLHRNTARPSATSLAGPSGSQAASKTMFSRSLTLLNRDYRQQHKSQTFKPSLTLDRYISDVGPLGPSTDGPTKQVPTQIKDKQPTIQQWQQRRRLKKKPTPQRINIDAEEFHQDESQDFNATNLELLTPVSMTQPVPSSRPAAFGVGGLFNWQSSYALDFGIAPLRHGVFFHESTFIGSGDFSRSLQVTKRNLDQNSRSCSIMIKDQVFQWSSWNENVSSQMGSVFESMVIELEQCTNAPEMSLAHSLSSALLAYRAMIVYVNDTLSFIDPTDRKAFVQRAMGLVSWLGEPISAFVASGRDGQNELVMLACYNLVFANQTRQIADGKFVDHQLSKDALDLVKVSAKNVISLALSKAGIASVQIFLEETKKQEERDAGIRDDFAPVTALVVTEQLLRSSESFNGVLADTQIDVCTKGLIRNQKDVANLESAWRDLFLLQPFIEIDHHGIARHDSRFKIPHQNWFLVKKLLSPALDNADANSAMQPISFNSYCRTIFQRCHRLINAWGWGECKAILDTLYDFFALKTLYNLKLEESRGSPAFLDELDGTPSLDIRPGEPCFHTLLKIIATGLRFLALKYDEKKIRNFAWRLLPNHGRVYPKEKPLRHEDLDALRNHHDLLCTLYWAVPEVCRPRLETIRNLVHPATSHQETCSINIRSWIRLIRFKMSTSEEVSSLEPFADWHSYFMAELQQQHSQARSEIEAQSKSDKFASKELVESLISQNQRQIESLLSMGLSGLRTAIELAPSLEHAHKVISKTPFDSIIGLFNPKIPRVNTVVSEALQVIKTYVNKDSAPPVASVPNDAPVAIEEDSQEFEGLDDWNDIDSVLVQQSTTPREEIEHVQRVLYPVVFRLLSNCFGADNSPEDAILSNVVDAWASIASALVRHGIQRWDNYLSHFGDRSWAQLRPTIQTRKYAAQFLALCIEKDLQILVESRNLVMGIWMASLVERAPMLKFQHRLTEALLNGRPDDLILKNLPFVKDQTDDRYHVSLQDIGQRRVSLISSVLSNMREHVLQLEVSGSRELSITKQDYSELLEQMMTAMKENYRELGNGAVESAQGAYVEFVHRIIRFLQELTSDIRPVDPFFTNPSSFPLPSTDPGYIVAKLKRYEPKLSSNKEVQTLTMFVQSILERATVERQQSNLVNQLHTALKGTYEAGRTDRPTLRAVLLQCVFPAYLELSFSTPTAWLLSRPIIQSISLVFKDLLFSLNTYDPACVTSLLRSFDAVFQSLYRALRPLTAYPRRFKDPVVLSMLAEFLKMVSTSLPVIDYLDRSTDQAASVISYLEWLRDLSTAVSLELNNPISGPVSDMNIAGIPASDLNSSNLGTGLPQHLVTGRRLAFEDHQSYLKYWSFHDSKYYYSRPGHASKEVTLDLEIVAVVQNEAEARRVFEDAKDEYLDFIDRLGLLSG